MTSLNLRMPPLGFVNRSGQIAVCFNSMVGRESGALWAVGAARGGGPTFIRQAA